MRGNHSQANLLVGPRKPLKRSLPSHKQPIRKTDDEGTITYRRRTDDKLHREDGPAVTWENGRREWWLNGRRHREDRPAIESADKSREWYQNGHLHRENGPAVERADGTKMWYRDGELHRLDGPAVEHSNGGKNWWVQGRRYSEKHWRLEVAKYKARS
jgi:hypothetical protein